MKWNTSPLSQFVSLKVEHGNVFVFFVFFSSSSPFSHITQNFLVALSEVQINPGEVEEYTLQILASNEV